MPKHGKKYNELVKKNDYSVYYEPAEALALVKEGATAKFDETIELHIKLGVDPKKADQNVRGSVALPNGLGKTIRVAVFAKGEKAQEAQAAGADIVGAEDLAEKIKAGFFEQFDLFIVERHAVFLVVFVVPFQAEPFHRGVPFVRDIHERVRLEADGVAGAVVVAVDVARVRTFASENGARLGERGFADRGGGFVIGMAVVRPEHERGRGLHFLDDLRDFALRGFIKPEVHRRMLEEAHLHAAFLCELRAHFDQFRLASLHWRPAHRAVPGRWSDGHSPPAPGSAQCGGS